jgi:2-oxoisovalerate dehydrogenase E2 component (dihydrolipoyl transacylase)
MIVKFSKRNKGRESPLSIEKIFMPKLGESVTEGTINTWLIKEGEHVEKYDPIADVMTDKVNAEVPSSFTGTIKEIVVQEGDTIHVGELICYIETEEGTSKTVDIKHENTNKEQPEVTSDSTSMKTRYSPAVLRLAQENNLDLATLTGSGLGGRITRKDVLSYVEQKKTQQPTTRKKKTGTEDTPLADDSTKGLAPNKGDKEISLTGVRKVIADHMVRSKQEIPHAWMTIEVDVTDLVAFRNQIKESFLKREGFNITYFAFFAYAVAQALTEYPEMNSVWNGDKVVQKHAIHLSMAVAKGNELFVPVIKNADERSLRGIAKEINRLATKGRTGTLQHDDMVGGTFTVNNTGTFGSVSSMGIINFPQVAILQVESIVKRPVIINDMFAARDIVNLSLSLDHRVLDGLICGRYLARIKQILEGMNDQTLTI